ncbi:universal stress protein [Streptomyces sp. NBC_01340]|uniref:universal stress protein n=1 Tax=unclassified Streptomyces TaxID=2593676 RepID=UPI00224EA86F|nr:MULTISPECIES: universal stress protein [unclassified Streptomyces]MCX4459747.1 universal stress protein [Streptomyces sp. NBC_01719]MCX4499105.1 universal stress protein [Streptomyces sp. NBC_01728]MCX4594984.1 universal stress protein [Streptomyces sp. NBC_01549]WSI43530.1 universal stress protein [Streptomyces sp. NBC_01340]
MSDPVIVGVDGSVSSLDAVDVATREAQLRGVPLRVVHAFGHAPGHLPVGAPPWSPADHGLEPMVHGVLARAEERAHAAAPDIEITRSVVAGEPLEVLEIESRAAALAVVGSRGLSGFAGLLLGSTAVQLAAHGHCPLMVVRGRPDPAGAVVLAVDGSEAGQAAVEFAFAEAALRRAPLVALHVWNTWSERAYEGPGDPLTAVVVDAEHLRQAEQDLLADAVAPLEEVFPQVAVERRLVRSRIRPALIDASRSAQLVVTGARGRGGFTGLLLGSVSQALLHHAHCPVTVVRGKE